MRLIVALFIFFLGSHLFANTNVGLPLAENDAEVYAPLNRFVQADVLCTDSTHPTSEISSFYFNVGGEVRAILYSKDMRNSSPSPFVFRNGGIYFLSQSGMMRIATVSQACGRAPQCIASSQFGQSAALCGPTIDPDVQIINRIASKARRVEIQYCGFLRIKPTRIEIIRYRGAVDFVRASQRQVFPYVQDVQITDCPTH